MVDHGAPAGGGALSVNFVKNMSIAQAARSLCRGSGPGKIFP